MTTDKPKHEGTDEASDRKAKDAREQAIINEGSKAYLDGLPSEANPYEDDETDRRLWWYGFENPPSEEGNEDEREDDE